MALENNSDSASSSEMDVLTSDNEAESQVAEEETPDEQEEESEEEEASEDEASVLDSEDSEEPQEEEVQVEEEKENIPRVEDQITRPSYKEVQKKYPNLFKEFPDMKEMYFRDAAYGAIFTSIEDAKYAAQRTEIFNNIDRKLASGDITGIVESINEKALPTFAEKILFSIRDVSPREYFRAINPAIAEILHAAYNDGEKKGNRQLQLSVKNLCNFLYDKPDLPRLQTRQVHPEVEAKVKELDDRERGIFERESRKFYDSIESSIESKLKTWVTNGLDPNNEMSSFMKDAIINATLNDVQELAKKDQNFMQSLKLMYNKAAKVGWTDNMKSQIISSYLGRVKDVVGSIRNRRRAEALGKRIKSIENQVTRVPPSSSSKSNGQSKNPQSIRDRKITASKIDMRKTSELDVLNGKAILK